MSVCLWLRMHNSLLPLNIYLLVRVQVTPQNRACRKHTSAVTSSWVHPYTQEKKSQILKQLKTYPPLTVAFILLTADRKGRGRERRRSQNTFLEQRRVSSFTKIPRIHLPPTCTYTKAYLTIHKNVELILSVSMSVQYLRQKVSVLLFLALGIILLGVHNMGKLQNLVCPRRMFWKKLLRKCPYQKKGDINPFLSLTKNST